MSKILQRIFFFKQKNTNHIQGDLSSATKDLNNLMNNKTTETYAYLSDHGTQSFGKSYLL